MPRWKIGAVALLLLVMGAGILLFAPNDDSLVWAYGCLRVGTGFATLWLAWDDMQKLPWWLLGSLLATVVVIAFAGMGTDLGDAYDHRLVLPTGTVIVVEPVIWDEGHSGYRSENVYVITEDGCVNLSDYSYAPYGGDL